MKYKNKKQYPKSIIRIPSFIFRDDVVLEQSRKHIYAFSPLKKTVLVCNTDFTSPLYISCWELEKINQIIKGVKDEKNL